ncbi:prenylated flavin chaperone LpdD [Methanocella arvoryzae]|uniref:Prenylated flavin chaperone LpdD-like domain-containing protein n=1 Tax=Methanocella arvoryzae (strain DSM 22066 / NBRC 105507 / MRE50) TaxID=351160 RepID=Q0W0E2_METAR|nr:hypothetical protein [Methanocella arvoryzae]CAJ38151.1 conserved hypothetical protein [Methanocella arvoryzae MRE50]
MNSQIVLEKSAGRLTVRLSATRIGPDLLVVISGGAAHIGAVGAGNTCSGLASSSVITMPGHRDDRIAKDAAELLAKKFDCNCVVVVGVHYDDITPQEIKDVMIMSNSLISEMEEALRTAE